MTITHENAATKNQRIWRNGLLALDQVTLVAIEGVDLAKMLAVVEHCTSLIAFKDVKILTCFECDHPWHVRIPAMDYEQYNVFLVKELWKWFDTSHALLIQIDGFVLDPQAWQSDWLNLDFMGAEWHPDWARDFRAFNGGFSLRSKRLQERCRDELNLTRYWPEDYHVSRMIAKDPRGMQLPDRWQCTDFSIECGTWTKEFGFHRSWCDLGLWMDKMPEHASKLKQAGVLK